MVGLHVLCASSQCSREKTDKTLEVPISTEASPFLSSANTFVHPSLAMEKNPTDRPLFIIGMPRSGTKLLRGILNEHPLVNISEFETEFFPHWVRTWTSYGNLADYSVFERFHRKLQSMPYYGYLTDAGMSIDPRQWYESCQGFAPANVFEALLKIATRFQVGRQCYWGDKSPSYITSIPLIHDHFPNARIIHIVRDVRDYCLSINKAWRKSVVRAAQRWTESAGAAHHYASLHTESVIEVRYEDLLADAASESARICRFLDIPYDDAMIRLTRPTENIGNTRGRSEIVKSNSMRYSSELSPIVVERIETIAGPTMEIFDYARDFSGPQKAIGKWSMRFYQLLDGVNLVLTNVARRGFLKSLVFYAKYYWITNDRTR